MAREVATERLSGSQLSILLGLKPDGPLTTQLEPTVSVVIMRKSNARLKDRHNRGHGMMNIMPISAYRPLTGSQNRLCSNSFEELARRQIGGRAAAEPWIASLR
jgi:hypothetical protein